MTLQPPRMISLISIDIEFAGIIHKLSFTFDKVTFQ